MSAKAHSPKRHWPRGVTILHEDADILVVDKPPGLLTMGTDRFDSETLYYKLTDYVRKGNSKSRARVFIVHRLDREASGILVFARHEAAKACLQETWHEAEKRYLAIVCGAMAPKTDVITSYLAENLAHVVYSTRDAARGKLSRTAYRVLRVRNGMSLLEVDLLTGRKHQIRVHLADKGYPIVGDKKYGSTERTRKRPRNDDLSAKRLALHAISLTFRHPATGDVNTFATKTPRYFTELMGSLADSA